jgi:hypothetical protein
MAFYYSEGKFSFYKEEKDGALYLYKVHSASGVIVDSTIIRK